MPTSAEKEMSGNFKPTGVALVELCTYSGAIAGFVQQGAELIESTLSISDAETEGLAGRIHTLVGEYRASGRSPKELYLEFERGTLLVVWAETGGVTLRFRGGVERLEAVIAECRVFLQQVLGEAQVQPAAAVPPSGNEAGAWGRCEPVLINLLARVVSRAQAAKMVQRTAESLGLPSSPPDDQIEKIVRAVLERVPDRRKRDALLAEATEEIARILKS